MKWIIDLHNLERYANYANLCLYCHGNQDQETGQMGVFGVQGSQTLSFQSTLDFNNNAKKHPLTQSFYNKK